MTKLYHMAAHHNDSGQVSALCFKTLKPIDLAKELWTIRPAAVTCPACIKIMREQEQKPEA